MRTIRTKVYKFSELSKAAKEQAICDHIQFEIEAMNEYSPFLEAAQEMQRMQTPWFLGQRIYHDPALKQIIINNIIINEYEFTKDGNLFR